MRRGLMFIWLAVSTGPVTGQGVGITTLTGATRTVFDNPDCKKTKSCDLKQVWYEVMDYILEENGDVKYGTGIRAGYVTGSVASLEKYIFVQLIRGCLYSSYKNALGVHANIDRLITLRGKGVKFWFPTWVLDSVDNDPALGTSEEYPSRHYGYRWGEKPDQRYYGLQKPAKPELHIKDFPSQAVFMNSVAENVSLEFLTCLYKTSEVPANVTSKQLGRATPLSCHKWRSSHIYDFDREQFTSPDGIAAVCSDERIKVISYSLP